MPTTHGKSSTGLYRVWSQVKTRCTNPNYVGFAHYGGRGITIFEPWRQSFERFEQDVGQLYEPGLWIERIDNERGYQPGNVRWATPIEQRRNRRELATGPVWVKVVCERCGSEALRRSRQVREAARHHRSTFCGRSCSMKQAQERRAALVPRRDSGGRFAR